MQTVPNQTVPPFAFQVLLPLVSNPPILLRIADDPLYLHSATWSPDGSRIAFLSERDGAYHDGLYLAQVDGSGVTRLGFPPPDLLPNSDGWIATYADWSPKGDKIAISFYSCSPCEGHGLYHAHTYVLDSNGQNFRRISTAANHPDWSPDGSKIAHTLQTSYSEATSFYVMDADGSNPIFLGYNLFGYTWSPDSAQIAYTAENQTQLTTITVDGSSRRILTEEGISYPAWSPDGRQIVYVAILPDKIELRVLDPDNPTPITLTQVDWASIELLTWLPDSERIIFWGREVSAGVPAFYVVDGDGSDLTLLFPYNLPAGTTETAWSPDRTKLLILVDNGLYVLQVPHE